VASTSSSRPHVTSALLSISTGNLSRQDAGAIAGMSHAGKKKPVLLRVSFIARAARNRKVISLFPLAV
jgi:hypothetical protein